MKANLFCNTCPGSDKFCVDCNLAGLHRNHDILDLNTLIKSMNEYDN